MVTVKSHPCRKCKKTDSSGRDSRFTSVLVTKPLASVALLIRVVFVILNAFDCEKHKLCGNIRSPQILANESEIRVLAQPMTNKDRTTEERALERYKSLSERIRVWLIVYGVSIAVLFITQAATLSHIDSSTKLFVLVPSFVAVMMQLILAVSIKYQNLVVYKAYSEDEPLTKQHRIYKVANWWSQAIWIDILVDVLTVICYIVATVVLTLALASTPTATAAPKHGIPNSQLGGKNGNQRKEEGRKKEGRQEEGRKKESKEEEKMT